MLTTMHASMNVAVTTFPSSCHHIGPRTAVLLPILPIIAGITSSINTKYIVLALRLLLLRLLHCCFRCCCLFPPLLLLLLFVVRCFVVRGGVVRSIPIAELRRVSGTFECQFQLVFSLFHNLVIDPRIQITSAKCPSWTLSPKP